MSNLISLNFESKSVMLPSICINLFKYTVSNSLSEQLINFILQNEQTILSTTEMQDGETDETWLTGRLWQYNLLDYDSACVLDLQNAITDSYKLYLTSIGAKPESVIYVQCWANIIRNNGRFIFKHNHADAHGDAPEEYSYVSGNLCLQAENTGTYYQSPFTDHHYRIENIPCEMILFPSFVNHWTDPNLSEDLRISLAFDIITPEVYAMTNNPNFKRITL